MSTKSDFSPRRLYDIYRVKLTFRDKLCGGKPKNDELLASHIRRTTGHDDELTKKQIEEAKAALPSLDQFEDLEQQQMEKSSSGFLSDEKGLYIDTYQVKAMFKQSASMLGIYKKKRGSKQICSEGVEIKGLVHESKLYLDKKAADGTDESVVHAMTAKGPISGIKRVDFVQGVTLDFEVWVLKTPAQETRHIGENEVTEAFIFAQENGLGADRAKGLGKFNIVSLAKVL